ncbi:uncharacterized protein LOC102801267 [Saccoglossus kowalevskii]|uniref:Branched-chain-amino-acid aminotransferase-like protein 2-like n=1 Tax=Saccoglossus kowalevskii TaxID=10224 RepID=A0ABM0LZR0_SACKO|nr:PREDICTED: branched-chain-amino-acid aminotransferase-like protein 2-like [Saccoglossus kowalevskii]
MANDPPTRVMLWTTARTRSTALELSLASVRSFEVFHELYTVAYVFGDDRAYIHPPEHIVSGYSYADVKGKLEQAYPGKEIVFAKDFAVCLNGNMENLPNGYLHTFLVRDPRTSVRSHYAINRKILEDIERYDQKLYENLLSVSLSTFSDVKHLVDLYRHVTESLGQQPVVIDSDELFQSPREVLERYCRITGIPFSESMLNWTAGNIDHWPDVLKDPDMAESYTAAIASSSYVNKASSYSDIELSKEMQSLVDSCVPMYQELIKFKI